MVSVMKESVIKELPNCKEDLNWIIDKFGYILFNNNWEKHRNILIEGNCKESSKGIGLIQTLDACLKIKQEKNELVNYIFTQAINKSNLLRTNW